MKDFPLSGESYKFVWFLTPLLLSSCVSLTASNWEEACERNNAEACALIATAYSEGSSGVVRDYTKAFRYATKACSMGAPIGCSLLAQMYDNGSGVPKSADKAVQYYEIACNQDESLACHNLAVIYSNGNGVKQSYQKSLEFFRKACELGRGYSCDGVGVQYEFGLGVEKSIPKATEFYFKGCRLKSPEACSNYQRLGRGLQKIQFSIGSSSRFNSFEKKG